MVRSMMSILDPDARHYKAALQSTMQSFIKLMKSDNYDKLHYWGLHQGHEIPFGQSCTAASRMGNQKML